MNGDVEEKLNEFNELASRVEDLEQIIEDEEDPREVYYLEMEQSDLLAQMSAIMYEIDQIVMDDEELMEMDARQPDTISGY